MATNNAVDVGLSGATGTGNFVGSTSPSITTGLNDHNGNAWITQTATATAVNHVNIVNNSTGNPPIIQVLGTDSAIALTLKTKDSNINIQDSTTTIAPAINFYNAAGTQFTGLKVPTSAASSVTFNLPSADAAGFLISDGSTNLSLSGTPTDITGSITVSGFSLLSDFIFTAFKVGKMGFYNFRVDGTSNSTSFSVGSLPYTPDISSLNFVLLTENNTTFGFGYAQLSGTTMTFFPSATGSSSSWTGSGTKGATGSFWFQTT